VDKKNEWTKKIAESFASLLLLPKHAHALQREKKLSYIYENDNETVHAHAHTQ
jgi:hypothetical protein